jgi:hypothetical protein
MSRKLNSYSVCAPSKGLNKRWYIGGLFSPNIISPLFYIQKPKWISDESFQKIVDAIRLEIPQGFHVIGVDDAQNKAR